MEPNNTKLFTALFSISFLFIAVLGFINASQSYRIEKLEKMEQRIEVLERSTEKGSSLKGDTTTSSASGEDITKLLMALTLASPVIILVAILFLVMTNRLT